MKVTRFKELYNYLLRFTRILCGKGVVRNPMKCLHIKRVPCHQGTKRPHFAYGRDGLHVRRVSTNTLHKQSRTADNGLSYRLGVG